MLLFFFFKQKTAYEMRISDWSSDVCSSDLTTLIGFAGAPWTVASYMLEGGSSKDFAIGKRWAYGAPQAMQRLIDLLVEATGDYLIAQIDAGAEAVQVFDSWAGVWPEAQLRDRKSTRLNSSH